MFVLGIETSCDETACAVVQDGRLIHSNIVATSLREHSKFGGIIPEIASRRQLELIGAVVESSLERASLTLKDIDAIAVTRSPGLIGSLLVGISYARALSFAAKKPLIDVDHIKAHLYANFLESYPVAGTPKEMPKLPAIGLIVSGGHTNLYLMKSPTDYKLLGQTRDDAAGEAFDKVSRILGLGYPGGPAIDRIAKEGVNNRIRFPQSPMEGTHDFSFSGVKTAVLQYHQKNKAASKNDLAQIAYSFQDSVVAILVKKSIALCLQKKIKTLLIGGGVAANSTLRQKLNEEGEKNGIKIFVPPMSLCLDNAAMIAGSGYHLLKTKKPTKKRIIVSKK